MPKCSGCLPTPEPSDHTSECSRSTRPGSSAGRVELVGESSFQIGKGSPMRAAVVHAYESQLRIEERPTRDGSSVVDCLDAKLLEAFEIVLHPLKDIGGVPLPVGEFPRNQ